MRAAKILVTTIVAAMIFAGFFAIFAAAEGTSFDDAKEISEGTYVGVVKDEYYYKVNVPAYKAILVTLTAGNNASVSLQIYDSERQDAGLWSHASAEDGETDKAFYDGKSATVYTVYIKILNNNNIFFTTKPSNYTIKIEFRPGDIKEGAKSINEVQEVSGTLKHLAEVNWYRIEVPKGEILYLNFTSSGGDISVTLYDGKGEYIDGASGTQGSVDTKTLGQTGTIYIEVKPYQYQNRNIEYTLSPSLTSGSSTVEKGATTLGLICWGGIIIGIIMLVLIIAVVIKVLQKK